MRAGLRLNPRLDGLRHPRPAKPDWDAEWLPRCILGWAPRTTSRDDAAMSHVIELTDEQYETLRKVAEARGQTPDAVIAAWLDEARERDHEPG